MRVVSAYLLVSLGNGKDVAAGMRSYSFPQAVLGGNSSPSEADIKKILSAGERIMRDGKALF